MRIMLAGVWIGTNSTHENEALPARTSRTRVMADSTPAGFRCVPHRHRRGLRRGENTVPLPCYQSTAPERYRDTCAA